jgi:hypothetical protein
VTRSGVSAQEEEEEEAMAMLHREFITYCSNENAAKRSSGISA